MWIVGKCKEILYVPHHILVPTEDIHTHKLVATQVLHLSTTVHYIHKDYSTENWKLIRNFQQQCSFSYKYQFDFSIYVIYRPLCDRYGHWQTSAWSVECIFLISSWWCSLYLPQLVYCNRIIRHLIRVIVVFQSFIELQLVPNYSIFFGT